MSSAAATPTTEAAAIVAPSSVTSARPRRLVRLEIGFPTRLNLRVPASIANRSPENCSAYLSNAREPGLLSTAWWSRPETGSIRHSSRKRPKLDSCLIGHAVAAF